ncbi:unnamed protein product, partial [Trichogramma brassicae]
RARQFRHAHCRAAAAAAAAHAARPIHFIINYQLCTVNSPQGSGTIRVESNSLELETFGSIVANRDRELGRGYTRVSLCISHTCSLDHVNDSAIVSGRTRGYKREKRDPIRISELFICALSYISIHKREAERRPRGAILINNFTRARRGAPFFTTGNCRRHSRTLTQLLIRFNHCTIRINIYNKTRSLYSISVQLFKND